MRFFFLLLCLLLLSPLSLAQDNGNTTVSDAIENTVEETEMQDSGTDSEDSASEEDKARFEFAVGVGWPGYHLYNLKASFQYHSFGLSLEGSATKIGPYIAVSGQYYFPFDLPTYLSVGGGIWSDETVLFATAGLQIPLGLDELRLTLEGGVSRVTVIDKVQVLPHVAMSLGYSFYLDTNEYQAAASSAGGTSREPTAEPVRAGSRPCNREPDEASLREVFEDRALAFATKLYTLYEGTYSNPTYNFSITSVSISGTSASASAVYDGSVVEILTGQIIFGNGNIDADFVWEECSWHIADYSYD